MTTEFEIELRGKDISILGPMPCEDPNKQGAFLGKVIPWITTNPVVAYILRAQQSAKAN